MQCLAYQIRLFSLVTTVIVRIIMAKMTIIWSIIITSVAKIKISCIQQNQWVLLEAYFSKDMHMSFTSWKHQNWGGEMHNSVAINHHNIESVQHKAKNCCLIGKHRKILFSNTYVMSIVP